MLPASVAVAGVFWLLSTIQLNTPVWFVVACHMLMSAASIHRRIGSCHCAGQSTDVWATIRPSLGSTT